MPADLTLRGVSEKLLHALTSIDARVLHTVRCLFSHPGELTLAWTRGTRREYVAPFQIFLIANVIFFGLQLVTATNIFSSPLWRAWCSGRSQGDRAVVRRRSNCPRVPLRFS